MGIKSIPTDAYHKYKYLIILDDFTSKAWTIPLHVKSAAIMATYQFLRIVKTQIQGSEQGWTLDFGGEYKSAAYNICSRGRAIEFTTWPPTFLNKMDAQKYLCAL